MSDNFPKQNNYGKTVNVVGNPTIIINDFTSVNRTIKFLDFPSLDFVYGREEELQILKDFFLTKNRHCSFAAASCFGKTFLIKKFLQDVYKFEDEYKNSFDKIIYFNCRDLLSFEAVVNKFEICLGKQIKKELLFQNIQEERILCIFDNFEGWVKNKSLKENVVSFVHKIFNTNNQLRTIFVSQTLPSNDENFVAVELTEIKDKLFKGLDKNSALNFALTEGKKVGLDKVDRERLVEFLQRIHFIPQAIRSLISYLDKKDLSFEDFCSSYAESFKIFEQNIHRFNDVNDLFRPTLFLLEQQILAQDDKTKELLSILAFFEKEIPEEIVAQFQPEMSVAESSAIKLLLTDGLAEKASVFRGQHWFIYYSLHLAIREVVRETLPKFEYNQTLAFEAYGKELINRSNDHLQILNHEESLNLSKCAEKLFTFLVIKKERFDSRNDLAKSCANQGLSLYNLQRYEEAIIEFDKSINILEIIVSSEKIPEIRGELALSYMNKGNALSRLIRQEAMLELDRSISILESLVYSEGRFKFRNDLARSYINKGFAFSSFLRYEEAIVELNKSIEICKIIVNEEKSLESIRSLSKSHVNKGLVLWHLKRHEEAIIEQNESIKILETLVEKSNRFEFRNDLAKSHLNKGNAYFDLEMFENAIIEYDKSIKIGEILVNNELRLEFRDDLALSYVNKGEALFHTQNRENALKETNNGIELLDNLVNKEGMYWHRWILDMALENKFLIINSMINS